MNALQNAIALAEQGYYVFPLAPDDKKPAIKGWRKAATRDPEQLRAWFERKPYNIGLDTSRYGDNGAALLVVDIDRKAGVDGMDAWNKARNPHGETPPTCVSKTAGDGFHVIYTVPAAVKQGANVLGPGVDIRSRGGYIVAPGSTIGGKPYAWQREMEPQPAPAWLVDSCGKATPERAPSRRKLDGIRPESAERRALEYLATLEPATTPGRNDAGFKAAARLKDLGCDEPQTLALMAEHWRCEPMLEHDELAHVVHSAYAYGSSPQGSAAPEAIFPPMEDAPKGTHPFDLLNQEWAAVAEPPITVVYRIRTDQGTGQTLFERYTREGFTGLMANRPKIDGKPIASLWWESRERRTYEGGTDYAPLQTVPANVLNTWGGWAVKPAPGDWSIMRAHICDVICGGASELDRYVMGWLAQLVQRPGEPGQVALVLRGSRGSGKGTLGEMLCRLFGVHGMHVANPRRVTGDFNGHLANKSFVFGDESFHAGDPRHESVLKALVTERAMDLEAKYQTARNVRNCVHLLLASNAEWVVPSGPLERRFCVLDVSNEHRQDIPYFDGLRAQMDAGGLAAMLHDLLAYDLGGFNVWAVPRTAAGAEQQTLSLRGTEKWLHDALYHERIVNTDWTDKGASVSKTIAYVDYSDRARQLGDYRPTDAATFWRKVSEVLAAGGLRYRDTRPRTEGGRERYVELPPLAESRQAFATYLGADSIDWGA